MVVEMLWDTVQYGAIIAWDESIISKQGTVECFLAGGLLAVITTQQSHWSFCV